MRFRYTMVEFVNCFIQLEIPVFTGSCITCPDPTLPVPTYLIPPYPLSYVGLAMAELSLDWTVSNQYQ